MIFVIGDDSKFEASQFRDQAFFLLNQIRLSPRNNNFNAVISHASDGDFLGTRRIDSLGNCGNHLIDCFYRNRLILFLLLLLFSRLVVDAIDKVGSPGEVDTERNRVFPRLAQIHHPGKRG